jgi:CRISPR system Cascade subunit CasC
MSDAKFLQIHTLTTYPGTLLNRDDAGFAKRLPFGGATRTRVSSQCLKYHWRNFDGEHALYGLDVEKSLRSRRTFKQLIGQHLVDDGHPERLVVPAVYTLKERVLSDNTPSKTEYKKLLNPADDLDLMGELETGQVTIFGEAEVRYMRELAAGMVDELKGELGVLWDDETVELSKEQVDVAVDAFKSVTKGDLKKNLKGLQLAAGLDAAMFGRMATSDVLARGDAAVHVAHAFTTHAENSESDYFSAVDELKSDSGSLGSGHINSSELTSGLFYGYIVVDVPLLVSNLEGVARDQWEEADRELAAKVVERMVHLVATVSPGAKLGSTAPYSFAQSVFVESGNSQPRTLANAFQRPVDERPDVLANTYRQMAGHLAQYDQMYGATTTRKLSGIGEVDPLVDAAGVGETVPVPALAKWAADRVRGVR